MPRGAARNNDNAYAGVQTVDATVFSFNTISILCTLITKIRADFSDTFILNIKFNHSTSIMRNSIQAAIATIDKR